MVIGIIGGSVTGIALCFLVYARLSGHLQFYTVPTQGCEPDIPRGAYILASDWKTPERLSIVCYAHDADGRNEIWLQRLCGLPGDTIAMREGRLLVNGEDADSTLRLKHRYAVTQAIRARLIQEGHLRTEDWHPMNSDSIAVHVADEVAARMRLKKAALHLSESIYHRPDWKEDEIPATVVPAGHWFLLGDNRHASQDSRYIGFVPVSAYLGTVLHVMD